MVNLLMMLLALGITSGAPIAPCVSQDGCYCQQTQNEYIDLQPIGNVTFNLIDDSGTFKYKFELCQTFNLPANCSSVYGCQFNSIINQYNDIASSPPEFADIYTIRYNTSSNITSFVQLYCTNGTDSFVLVNNTDPSHLQFRLETRHACPQMLHTTVSPSTTLSTSTTSNTTTAHANTTASSTTAHSNTTAVTTSPTTHVTNSTASSYTTASTSPLTTLTTTTGKPLSSTTHISSTTHSGAMKSHGSASIQGLDGQVTRRMDKS
ncbi:cell wall protein DAN4 [Biomphalaria pfeifferi]|uniref:Cell wall protein DAN4 n=1 Tax=Biomphalaria pfeifferi TaxID=112525 RepID=A0AAD8BG75_BIOPF|nr:cell wall protein DAN4 [Biomphalaria pfeifferi]